MLKDVPFLNISCPSKFPTSAWGPPSGTWGVWHYNKIDVAIYIDIYIYIYIQPFWLKSFSLLVLTIFGSCGFQQLQRCLPLLARPTTSSPFFLPSSASQPLSALLERQLPDLQSGSATAVCSALVIGAKIATPHSHNEWRQSADRTTPSRSTTGSAATSCPTANASHHSACAPFSA